MYDPPEMETRTLFGLQMEQRRNDTKITKDLFTNVVSTRKEVRFDQVLGFVYQQGAS